MNFLKIFIISFILGLLLHFLPNYQIPLHSDVNWMFLLQTTANPELIKSIPFGLKTVTAYPDNIIRSSLNWYQVTGRFNSADIIGLRFTSLIAKSNADWWRIIYIFFLISATSLFYLIGSKLKISQPILLILTLGLFFSPLEIWTQYKSAEPRAIFFLMLSYFLVFYSKNIWLRIISALSFVLAVLTKETFLPALLVIPGLIFYSNFTSLKKIKQTIKLSAISFIPYIIGLVIILSYVLYLKVTFPLLNSGYITPATNPYPFWQYLIKFGPNIVPTLLSGLWLPIFTFIGIIIYLHRKQLDKFNRIVRNYFALQNSLLILCLFISILLCTVIFYLNNLNLGARYIVPANFLVAFLLGTIATPFYEQIKGFLSKGKIIYIVFPLALLFLWPNHGVFFSILNSLILLVCLSLLFLTNNRQLQLKILFVGLLTSFLLPQLDLIINNSVKDGVDQNAWSLLVEKVSQTAPQNSHIILKFDEPNMIETAQGLEANTLLAGRYDLTYHLEIVNPGKNYQDNSFVGFLVNSFNKERKEFDKSKDSMVTIEADRRRKGSSKVFTSSALADFKLLITYPNQFFYKRYVQDKFPYLNYKIY